MQIRLDPKELKPAKSLGIVSAQTRIQDKDDTGDISQTSQTKKPKDPPKR